MGSLGKSSVAKQNGPSAMAVRDDVSAPSRPAFDISRIAIIGAGPSGLAAAKHLLAEGFTSIDIYEQQAEIGGVWNYSAVTPSRPPCVPQTDAHVAPDPPIYPSEDGDEYEFDSDEEACTAPGSGSCSLPPVSREEKKPPVFPNPMYDDLHANIPHTLMGYSDLRFIADEKAKGTHKDCEIFASRQVVQEYLLEYARAVRHLIRFSTQVTDVSLVPKTEDTQARIIDQWALRSTNLLTDVSRTAIYDAVVVASGHYATPYIPSTPEIAAFATAHQGVISHSKTYRTPTPFAGKRVVIVGAGASGLDIAAQISAVCATPLIVSARSPIPEESAAHLGVGDRVRVVGQIERFLVAERGIEVRSSTGGTETITDVDAILFCTGYLYTYPFFSPSSFSSSTPALITDGRRVHGVARHFLHIHHPSLVFPGLPIKVIPFPLAESQAAVSARLWSNRLPLPSQEELENWVRQDEEGKGIEGERVNGEGRPFHVFPRGGDGRYINAMHDWAMQAGGKEPTFWGEKEFWQRGIYIEAKMRFEKMGRKAKSLEEIGFVYGEGCQE